MSPAACACRFCRNELNYAQVILAARAHATALLHFIAVPQSRTKINECVMSGEVNAFAWVNGAVSHVTAPICANALMSSHDGRRASGTAPTQT
jgi:hypothetical protein